MLTTEQLEARKSGIGGSDLAAMLGVSPWKTPYRLWLEKSGREERDAPANPDAIAWGNDLEDVIAKRYAQDRGVRVRRRNQMFERGRMLANVDRTVDGQPVIVECKVVHPFVYSSTSWGESGTDEAPLYYLTQAHHYMTVKPQYERVDIAAYVAGMPLQVFPVHRDAAFCDDLERQVDEWWERHVIGDLAPDPVNEDDLRAMYSRDKGDSVEASPQIMAHCLTLAEIRAEMKRMKEDASDLELLIKSHIGEHGALTDPGTGKVLATWKSQKSRRLDQKALAADHPAIVEAYKNESESRRFLFKDKAAAGITIPEQQEQAA